MITDDVAPELQHPRDYIDFILERKDLRHWKAPVTHEKFYDMLGYYSPFEILPSEKSAVF